MGYGTDMKRKHIQKHQQGEKQLNISHGRKTSHESAEKKEPCYYLPNPADQSWLKFLLHMLHSTEHFLFCKILEGQVSCIIIFLQIKPKLLLGHHNSHHEFRGSLIACDSTCFQQDLRLQTKMLIMYFQLDIWFVFKCS